MCSSAFDPIFFKVVKCADYFHVTIFRVRSTCVAFCIFTLSDRSFKLLLSRMRSYASSAVQTEDVESFRRVALSSTAERRRWQLGRGLRKSFRDSPDVFLRRQQTPLRSRKQSRDRFQLQQTWNVARVLGQYTVSGLPRCLLRRQVTVKKQRHAVVSGCNAIFKHLGYCITCSSISFARLLGEWKDEIMLANMFYHRQIDYSPCMTNVFVAESSYGLANLWRSFLEQTFTKLLTCLLSYLFISQCKRHANDDKNDRVKIIHHMEPRRRAKLCISEAGLLEKIEKNYNVQKTTSQHSIQIV